MKKEVFLFIVYILFFSIVFVTADEENFKLDEVVITESIDSSVAFREKTSSYTVINRDEFEKYSSHDVPALISGRVPGVFVTERSIFNYGIGPGSAGTISIRGLGGSAPNTSVLVLIDGQPTKMGIFGHPIADAYPLEMVDRVEVLRGSHSLHYGNNALGGAINIVTRKMPGQGFRTEIKGGYGMEDSYRISIANGFRADKWDYNAGIIQSYTEGERPNSAFDGWNLYGKSGLKLGDYWKINLNGWGVNFTLEDPGPVSNPAVDDWRKVERYGAGINVYNESGKTKGLITLYGEWGDHTFSDGWRSSDKTIGIRAYQSVNITTKNRLEAGFDAEYSGGEGKDIIENKYYGKEYESIYGFWIDDEHVLFNKLSVQGGIRLQLAEQFDGTLIPRIGAVYSLSDDVAVHGQIGRGYRAPTIRDLYFFPPSNEDLQPEDSWSYEAGIRGEYGTLSFDVTGFFINAKNLIVFTSPPPSYENTGNVRSKGIETSLDWVPSEWFSMLLSYTFTDQNNRVAGTPRHCVYLSPIISYKKCSFFTDFKYVKDLTLDDNNEFETYFTVNARINYKITESVAASISLNNIFDEDYQLVKGYPMPGRWLYLEMKVVF